jgi:hypothetical protein
MLVEVIRVLRPRGRFVMRNICPQEHPDWLYYDYFPESRSIDLADFWPAETIVAVMEAGGFADVAVEREHLRFEQDMGAWLDMVRQRDSNSQLMSISEAAYAAGISRLERELSRTAAAPKRTDHLCLLTVRGDKRSG